MKAQCWYYRQITSVQQNWLEKHLPPTFFQNHFFHFTKVKLKTPKTWIGTNHIKIWSGFQQYFYTPWSQYNMLELSVSNSHFLLFCFPLFQWASRKTASLLPFQLLKITRKISRRMKERAQVISEVQFKKNCILYFVWENTRYCSLKLFLNVSSPSLCCLIVCFHSFLSPSIDVALDRHTNSLLYHNTCGELSSQSPHIYHQEQVFSGFQALETSWLWGCCLSFF